MFRIGKSFEMQMSIFFFKQYVINSYSTNNACLCRESVMGTEIR